MNENWTYLRPSLLDKFFLSISIELGLLHIYPKDALVKDELDVANYDCCGGKKTSSRV
jgi:hypothetical protein